MAVNFGGLAVVRLSMVFQLGDQIAIVDRNMSALNAVPGVLWNSSAFFAQAAVNLLPSNCQAITSNDANFLGFKLYQHIPGNPPLTDFDTSGSGAGLGGAGHMATQNCGLVSWQSDIGGKQGKGRDYSPFPAYGAALTTGGLAPAFILALTNWAGVIQAGFTVPNAGLGGGTLTVYPCTKYVTPVVGIAFRMVGFSVALGFATQRRRGFFGKQNRSPF